MAGPAPSSQKFRRRLAEVNESVKNLKPADVRAALTGRNAAFALGAALVVVLLWIFNVGGDNEERERALRDPQSVPPSEIVKEMKDPVEKASERQAALDPKTKPEKKPKRLPPGPARQYPESVEVDVSSKSVAVTAAFSGQQIVVFGAVHNSQAPSDEAELYDVVVVLEGMKTPIVTRRKANVAGIWINTDSVTFESVPSYYTISSTRPIEEITTPAVLDANEIGFRHVRIEPTENQSKEFTEAHVRQFKEAIVRLKAKEGLYQKKEHGVEFKGRSLFRTSIDLPANVPIGEVIAKSYLFRDAELIAQNTAKFQLERQGFEALMYSFAFDYPLLYGIFAVALAVAAGLIASTLFRRGSH